MSVPSIFPSRLRTTNTREYLTLDNNNQITNHSLHNTSICANLSIPVQAKYFFFEIIVQNVEKGSISVGLIPEFQFSCDDSLGKKYGYGLRSDGHLFSEMNSRGIDWSFCIMG
jgi:hypothetical protein